MRYELLAPPLFLVVIIVVLLTPGFFFFYKTQKLIYKSHRANGIIICLLIAKISDLDYKSSDK